MAMVRASLPGSPVDDLPRSSLFCFGPLCSVRRNASGRRTHPFPARGAGPSSLLAGWRIEARKGFSIFSNLSNFDPTNGRFIKHDVTKQRDPFLRVAAIVKHDGMAQANWGPNEQIYLSNSNPRYRIACRAGAPENGRGGRRLSATSTASSATISWAAQNRRPAPAGTTTSDYAQNATFNRSKPLTAESVASQRETADQPPAPFDGDIWQDSGQLGDGR